ncbi:MAG: class I SAM-dependent methyltransferase [Verrucomicrobia bacterium]|nr:class I SAM-dependent methyltransferase [Verrucomicrobiota bacterium]MBV8274090.1 class I SAM-dependent methyltransferase [Verrucomicrobiota bacterium]
MNKILEEILEKRVVVDSKGKEYPLHAHTSPEQGEFLSQLVTQVDANVCVEVGLAFGISSLYIAEAISKKTAPRLISIDPFQKQYWHDIGRLNLERAGYSSFVEFHEGSSNLVLPELLANGEHIDFAYVDSVKVFDALLIDAYYLTRLLKIGGLLVFDDCDFPGVKRMVRYISKWPHLLIANKHNVYRTTLKWRTLSKLIQIIPKNRKIFSDSLVISDEKLGTNATCIAFKKIAEDERPWDWTCNF